MAGDLEQHYIKFENNQISTILDNSGKLWFGGVDSAKALEYKNAPKAIRDHVDKDDKIQLGEINIDVKLDKHPHTVFINEGGLYDLIMSSEMEKAKKFKKWITHDVLPTIREFGYYKMKKKYENENEELLKKINYLIKQNEEMKNDLKIDDYPNGALAYVLDYSDENEEVYRPGQTGDMTKRKKIYDTHMLHKKKVVYMMESKNPLQLEMCVRSMLYGYRYKNKKDFYMCSLETIKKAFSKCEKSIADMVQKGGSLNYVDLEIEKINKKIKYNDENLYKEQIIIEDFRKKLNNYSAKNKKT